MFVCLLSTDGTAVTDIARSRYLSRIRALASASAIQSEHIRSIDASEFTAFVAPALVPLRPLWGRSRQLLGVGNVRLDHRTDVQRWSNSTASNASDLDLVLEAIESRGTPCLSNVLGDFALVVWDARTRTLTAARDAFGVKTLFMGQRGQLLVLSSHVELVRETDTLDQEYIAEFLLAGYPGPTRTIWADAQAVAQGSILTVGNGKLSSARFWNPHDFAPTANADQRTQIEEFGSLFREGVRTRLEPNGPTWAELSGGLDSSSVVSVAQTLARSGVVSESLAGTISIVDELGSGNEQRFSELVVRRFDVPNTIIANPWPWQDDGHGPPCTDEPRAHYPFFARDRLICDTVRAAGAHVLLSGMGSDHYLYGNRLFIADLIADGHVVRGVREAARWAVAGKRSFWTAVGRDALLPLLPMAVQLRLTKPWLRIPDWLEPRFAQRFGMTARLPVLRPARAPAGRKFAREMANYVEELTRWLPRGPFEEGMELRYPFLYRPLVEFGLRLPATMRAQPQAPKWILREAMRGILPEDIRTRSGKGAVDTRIIWGVRQESQQISEILSGAVLPQLNIVDTQKLRAAMQRARDGETISVVQLLTTLSLETWLAARRRACTAQREASPVDMTVHHHQDALSA